MASLSTFRFLKNHPLIVNHKLEALRRFVLWKVSGRLLPRPMAVVVDFVNDTRLVVGPGMVEGNGNICAGLHEFEDMSFVLHLLRQDDIFIDVGANIGAYTVLAGAAVGARCVSIEPVPATFSYLTDNINLNQIGENVRAFNIGAGRENEVLSFTTRLDTENHVATNSDSEVDTVEVPVRPLDDIVGDSEPLCIKIDVEGFEMAIVEGARDILSKRSLLAVIMELNGNQERYDYDESALHQSMLDFGFRPFSYCPFSRELVPLDGKNHKTWNTLYLSDVQQVSGRVRTGPKFRVDGYHI
jgi:FkbM family methyltransferase